ncbi:MAG: hypothetical protein ABR545_09940 [Cyclonatronaceae bacterium]
MKTDHESSNEHITDPGIDLSYRPDTYWPDDPAYELLISRIKGKKRREMARALHQKCDIPNLLIFLHRETLPENERSAWGQIHPSFMGGEYLPSLLPGEVEIARISLESTTADQISVRARPEDGWIHYSVADEYAQEPFVMAIPKSRKPLTLKRMIEQINMTEDAAGDLFSGLVRTFWYNCKDGGLPIEEIARFVDVDSDFYPELADWFGGFFEEWVRESYDEDALEEDGYFSDSDSDDD